MNSIKNIIATAAVAITISGCSNAHAAETTIKPLQGISFHAGTKHVVGYFLSDNGSCKLVITAADDANFAPTRSEAAIEAGKWTHYELSVGKSLEFGCQAEAQAMSVKSLEAIAEAGLGG